MTFNLDNTAGYTSEDLELLNAVFSAAKARTDVEDANVNDAISQAWQAENDYETLLADTLNNLGF